MTNLVGQVPSLAALRTWAEQARPVFVVGPPRSGTSMLLLALAQHPALFPVKGVFETFIFHRPQAVLSDPVPGMLRSYIGGEAGLQGLRQRWTALQAEATVDAANPLPGQAVRTAEQRITAVDDDLLRLFFHYAAESVYGRGRILEKTPGHLNSLPRIFRLFPHARVLACVREPVDVLRSYRMRLVREQAMGKPEQAWSWLTVDEPDLARQLMRGAHNLEQAAQRWPGQVFQVPYAWITSQPREAMAQICGFLGEAFDEQVLEPHRKQGANKPGGGKAGPHRADPKLGRAIGQTLPPSEAVSVQLTPEAIARLTAGLPAQLSADWQRSGPLGVLPAA
jgi:hypothetical protein